MLYGEKTWIKYSSVSENDSTSYNTFLNQLYPMYYGEYFGRVTDFNESFSDIKNFYNNLEDKSKELKKMDYFYPSQITYYVDEKGNIVSLDPPVDNVNVSSTPTQSMYNPAELVTKNAYDNYILTQNTDYVFYTENNGDKTLLKNNVEFLYSLPINKTNMVFDEYNYAFSYLKQYIITNGRVIN